MGRNRGSATSRNDRSEEVGIYSHGALPFWKGRVALFALLKAAGVRDGSEVVVPGFTCVVVPNAVIALGGKPVYADIEPTTFNITARTLKKVVRLKTKIVLVQNTFGLSPDIDSLAEICNERGVWLIEDCAHGLGGAYRDTPSGTITHGAFFSTQWSKPISTGLGGIAYARDPELGERLRAVWEELPTPSFLEELALLAQWVASRALSVGFLWNRGADFYRLVTQRLGFPIGSSLPLELRKPCLPKSQLKKMGRVARRILERELRSLPERIRRRRAVAAWYDEILPRYGLQPPARPSYAYHSMLRYPVRVKNKWEVLRKARKLGIPVGDWFVSPLHPVRGDLSPWYYQKGSCPEAEKACAELINLPTDFRLTKWQLDQLFGGT